MLRLIIFKINENSKNMIVQLEKIKSVVLCKDREFKRKSVQMLNSAAFSGEKFDVKTFQELEVSVTNKSFVCNIVINHCDFKEDSSLEPFLKKTADFHLKNIKLGIKILVYTDEIEEMLQVKEWEKKFPSLVIRPFPQQKKDFMQCFHKAISFADLKGQDSTSPPKKTASKITGTNLVIFEASAHVKETISMLNTIMTDSSKVEEVYLIGQRFNGVFGTFAHLKSLKGFDHLENLGRFIDSICKTYENDKSKKIIDPSHLSLLVDCAKNSYQYLQKLREENSDTKELEVKFTEISKRYQEMPELYRRENHNQDSVDNLIDDLLDKKSS